MRWTPRWQPFAAGGGEAGGGRGGGAAAAECTVHAEVLYRSVRGGMDALLSDYRAYFAPEGADAARDFGLAAMRSAAELLALCTTKSSGGLDAWRAAELTIDGKKAVGDAMRDSVGRAMRNLFQRSMAVAPQAELTAPLWLCTVLRAVQRELKTEQLFSTQLQQWLPAAAAAAAAALWKCVQPLLQATLLSTASLDADALQMLEAIAPSAPSSAHWASPCTCPSSPSSERGCPTRPPPGKPRPPTPSPPAAAPSPRAPRRRRRRRRRARRRTRRC